MDQIIAAAKDPNEEPWGERLEKWFVAEPAFIQYFEDVEEEGALPDLFGKSVLASRRQLPEVHDKVEAVARVLGCTAPECFVYESYSYLCDSEGLGRPRLELSARAVRDFDEDELIHLIAKEMYHIAAGHLRREVMTEKMLELIRMVPELPGLNLLKQFGSGAAIEAAAFTMRNTAFNWFKHACFSAENFATAYTGNARASVAATLMTILNERGLVEAVDLQAYMDQISAIESLLGPLATLDKADEVLPYGPYRVQNMLRYAVSDRGRELTLRCTGARGQGG